MKGKCELCEKKEREVNYFDLLICQSCKDKQEKYIEDSDAAAEGLF